MFVLPLPPRYPSTASYNQAIANGQVAPVLEANNVLSHPSGPEYQLVVGEGTYLLKEDLHLATPPPHPSETPVVNPNPLATDPQPATTGTKISLVSLRQPAASSLFLYKVETNKSTRSELQSSIQEHPNESRGSGEIASTSDGALSTEGSARLAPSTGFAPAFGEGNVMLSGTKDVGKRRKPKNNIAKSNSSFISRSIIQENIAKRLQERSIDGYYAFANINRAFQWLDLSSAQKADQLIKILFTKGHCLCHDINQLTKSATHIDLIMGFSTGEIIWFEPMSQKYTRLNKNGIINSAPLSEIRWIPGSENLFLAAHMDGTLIVYDKEKEDTTFSSEESNETATNRKIEIDKGGNHATSLHVEKSVHSKNQKFNPVAFWKLSNQRVNAFAFSPDNRHIAVVSEDGTLRIIDYLKEKLLDVYYSYYGGFLCVCWSPDGKYVLTGGQDDLVSIWSVADSVIVARCHGHQSWVTAVCFDPWRCDDKNYRFGSVGEDCRLLLWDFSVGMLRRPKASSVRHRGSMSSRLVNTLHRSDTQFTNSSRLRSNSGASAEGDEEQPIEHPVEPRATIAMLPPVMSKIVDPDPLCWLEFTQESILTSCKSGHIKTWDRPRDGALSINGDGTGGTEAEAAGVTSVVTPTIS